MTDSEASEAEGIDDLTDQPMTDEEAEAFEKFKECAVEVLHVPAEKVTPKANFAEDLDADSLDLVELVMALEEQFGITVDESELEGVSTVGKAFNLVYQKL
jgi:acyl carrier protein